jgi:hypothetical protein
MPFLQTAANAASDAIPSLSSGPAVVLALEAFLEATGEFLMNCLQSARRGLGRGLLPV